MKDGQTSPAARGVTSRPTRQSVRVGVCIKDENYSPFCFSLYVFNLVFFTWCFGLFGDFSDFVKLFLGQVYRMNDEIHEYDPDLAANISPEEDTDQESRHSVDMPDHTLKSNECDRSDADSSADEVGDSCWKRLHFSYFTFSKEVMASKPKKNTKIRGECKKNT
ncbi:hypothetical protein OUZ56_032059 [Daphnia magna]|uniref:Uncharacterized protein n=1 Tax=Daphnia magna TaxID=35525 RepID=A0ABQ9ZW04_9CRUS|nr:hypothetical protein OUZ56_032059 [Daphnia magna]